MKQFKLDCRCETSTWVNKAQAGEMVVCVECNSEIQVPEFSKLAQLDSRDIVDASSCSNFESFKKRLSKVDELSLFTAGVGIILGALVAWLSLTLESNENRTWLTTAIPLGIAALLVFLGLLCRVLRNRESIYLTIGFLVLTFGADVFVSFNPIKSLILFGILSLIIKTGREAISEISRTNDAM